MRKFLVNISKFWIRLKIETKRIIKVSILVSFILSIIFNWSSLKDFWDDIFKDSKWKVTIIDLSIDKEQNLKYYGPKEKNYSTINEINYWSRAEGYKTENEESVNRKDTFNRISYVENLISKFENEYYYPYIEGRILLSIKNPSKKIKTLAQIGIINYFDGYLLYATKLDTLKVFRLIYSSYIIEGNPNPKEVAYLTILPNETKLIYTKLLILIDPSILEHKLSTIDSIYNLNLNQLFSKYENNHNKFTSFNFPTYFDLVLIDSDSSKNQNIRIMVNKLMTSKKDIILP